MLKALLKLAVGAALIACAIVVYAATKPDTFSVARSQAIAAPPEKIFPLINDLRAFNTWNPFATLDPAAKMTYSGPQSGKAAAYAWDGNSDAGKGDIEISDSQPPGKIIMNLHFNRPMEGNNTVTFTIDPEASGSKVTWAMSGQQPLMAKIMTVFIDCDAMVGREFEKGLASLKSLAEKP